MNGKRQILVADDEEINREILGLALEEDYEVLCGADGQEALILIHLHRETLSIILPDLMMPRLSGIEVLKRLREDPSTAQIPVNVRPRADPHPGGHPDGTSDHRRGPAAGDHGVGLYR